MKYLFNTLLIVLITTVVSCSKKETITNDADNHQNIVENDSISIDSTLLKENIALEHPSNFDDTLVFTVQVGAFSNRNSLMEKSENVMVAKEKDSLIKYRFGNFNSYEKASKFKQTLQQLYPDAFIVPLNKGQRIDIKEALEISKEGTL